MIFTKKSTQKSQFWIDILFFIDMPLYAVISISSSKVRKFWATSESIKRIFYITTKSKPEYEDLAKIAQEKGISIREVLEALDGL